jgi:hypothetical protein
VMGKVLIPLAVLFVLPAVSLADGTLVQIGSTWKYLDNGTDQGTAWRASSFNDST